MNDNLKTNDLNRLDTGKVCPRKCVTHFLSRLREILPTAYPKKA